MLSISVAHNIDATIRRLQAQAKQVEFAKVVALTRVAQQAAADVKAVMPQQLDRPTPFTLGSIGWKGATKADPQSVVFIRPLAVPFLSPLISGGVVQPKRRALLDPTNVQLNQYGNLPRGKVKALLARKDVFSGTVRGIPGIWQRQKRGGVKLLVRYQGEQQKRAQFDFPGIVRQSVERNWSRLFGQALDGALRTAR